MDDDNFSFDFESKLEEQQRSAATQVVAGPTTSLPAAAGPAGQSTGSKRNYRQVSIGIAWKCCKSYQGNCTALIQQGTHPQTLHECIASVDACRQRTVCTYWLKGVCALGDNCGFLHEYNTERMPVCKTLIRYGICKEPDCPFKHNLEDIKECNMFKLGFCIYGPQCRYRHTRLPGPPPAPANVDAAKPKPYRHGGREGDRHDGGRGRGRYGSFGRGRRDNAGSGTQRNQQQLEGPSEGQQPRPPQPPRHNPPAPRPPPMPPGVGYGPMGIMGMTGLSPMGMPVGMGMPMGMPMPPFWRGPYMGPRGPFPPYGYR